MKLSNFDEAYEIKNEQIEKALKYLGKLIGESLPKEWGFNLMLFSYGEGGSLFYISSAQREDVIKLMKEFIEKQENKK